MGETVNARLLEVAEQTQLVRTASAKVTSTAEEVRRSVRKLRDQLNGPSGDLATANAQLRKENDALKGLLEEQTGTPLDVRSATEESCPPPFCCDGCCVCAPVVCKACGECLVRGIAEKYQRAAAVAWPQHQHRRQGVRSPTNNPRASPHLANT